MGEKSKRAVSPLAGKEKQVLALYKRGMTDKQVAAVFGVKYHQARYVRYIQHGMKSRYDNSRKLPTERVKKMLAKGWSYARIAESLGKTKDQVRVFCSNHGLVGGKR